MCEHVCLYVSVCVGASVMDQAIPGMTFLWASLPVCVCVCVCLYLYVWERVVNVWVYVCVCVRMMDQPISTEAGWQRGAEDGENGRMFWYCDQSSDVFWLLK